MDIFSFVGEITIAVVKHGWSVSTLVIFVFALFKFAPFRRFVMRHLPRKLKMLDNRMDSMDVRMKRMESKIDALMSAGGVSWAAHSAQVSKSQDVTDGQKISLKPTWETRVRARFIGAFTSLMGRLYRSKTRGESIQMKKFTSRKFILAVTGAVLIILNDGLDLGIDSETVLAFAGLLAVWIGGESAVDAKRAGGNNKMDEPGDTGPAV